MSYPTKSFLLLLFSSFILVNCQTRLQENAAEAKSASDPQLSADMLPQVFTVVSVEKVKAGSDKEFAYSLSLETPLEVWCERSCGKFSVVELKSKETLTLVAMKLPVKGNMKPSSLATTKTLGGKTAEIKKIILKNVGKTGNDVDLSEVISKDVSNFHAGFGEIQAASAIGGESSGYMIRFRGKSMDVEFKDPGLAAQVSAASGGVLKGFVTGNVVKKDGVERGTYDVFQVRTLDTNVPKE